jgi:hypothetical protein
MLFNGFAGLPVTVGGSGAGGTAGGNGSSGGSSSFGGATAGGGQGGGASAANTTSAVAGALGPSTATGGTIKNIIGNTGGISAAVIIGAGSFGIPAVGGGICGGQPGNNAPGFGGGGGGTANNVSSAAIVGHSGSPGMVEIWEYS